MLLVGPGANLLFFQTSQLLAVLLAKDFQVVYSLGILHGFEDLVESFLEDARLAHRPQGLILVTEDDELENGFRYA